ncbi:MAG: sulfotransferase [Calditrichaceae bacterium]
MNKTYKPVIIIGAPRSGTNILRDVLTSLSGVGTWPCDEINYIWRHGNVKYPSDEFPPDLANLKVKEFINGQFRKLAIQYDLDYIVEKTCANSLRVGFVNEVMPNAKYIFIIRNGIDVTASAIKRWKADLDLKYVLRKARYIPASDIPYYSTKYIWNRLYKLMNSDKRLAFWGPKLNEMNDLSNQYSIHEIAALQWQKCVINAENDFKHINETRIHRLKYENFVLNPENELAEICDFMEVPIPNNLNLISKQVSKSSIGKGTGSLNPDILNKIVPLIKNTLQEYNY